MSFYTDKLVQNDSNFMAVLSVDYLDSPFMDPE